MDTEKIKHRYEHRVSLHMFEQSKFPRISKESLRPLPKTVDSPHSRQVHVVSVVECFIVLFVI